MPTNSDLMFTIVPTGSTDEATTRHRVNALCHHFSLMRYTDKPVVGIDPISKHLPKTKDDAWQRINDVPQTLPLARMFPKATADIKALEDNILMVSGHSGFIKFPAVRVPDRVPFTVANYKGVKGLLDEVQVLVFENKPLCLSLKFETYVDYDAVTKTSALLTHNDGALCGPWPTHVDPETTIGDLQRSVRDMLGSKLGVEWFRQWQVDLIAPQQDPCMTSPFTITNKLSRHVMSQKVEDVIILPPLSGVSAVCQARAQWDAATPAPKRPRLSA